VTDPFNLARFIDAQKGVYDTALAELKAGRKTTHWMWFVFPQIAGLGRSSTARHFALSGLDEAITYLDHPLLGKRLVECTEAVNGLSSLSAYAIFGSPDDLKFHSSMTLFAEASPESPVFRTALDHYFDGKPDPATLGLLGSR